MKGVGPRGTSILGLGPQGEIRNHPYLRDWVATDKRLALEWKPPTA